VNVRFWWLLALLALAALGVASPQDDTSATVASGPRVSEQILTQEVRQQAIGRRTDRVSRILREEIVQELQQNKLGSPEELKRLGRMVDALIVVARTHVPDVVEDLREARAALDALMARRRLGEATVTQATILELLNSLVEKLSAREQLGSLIEQAEELVTRQQELNLDTRQTAVRTLGKRLEDLSGEERRQLAELSQRQEDQRQHLARLQNDVARTAEQVAPQNPQQARALTEARKFVTEQQVEPTMAEIARELEQNQVLSAAQKEQKTLENLNELRDRLASAEENPFQELARRQQELDNLINEQQELRSQTGRMTPQSPSQEMEAAEQRQSALAQRSRELASSLEQTSPATSQNLDQAGQKMQEATERLDERRPGPAAKAQDEALAALQDARKALGLQLSRLAQMQMALSEFDQRMLDILTQQRDQMNLLMQIAEDVSALGELLQRQEEQSRNTAAEAGKPEADRQPEPLAQEQKDIAAEAGDMAESVARYDQESSGHVARAESRLEEAAGELAKPDFEKARPPQAEGLAELKQGRDILQKKFKRILELLSQLEQLRQNMAAEGHPASGLPEMGSLDDLIELANNLVEVQRLAGDQEGTHQETSQAEAEQARALAGEQQRLKDRAGDLSQKAQRLTPRPAADIRRAGGEMAQAEDRLRASLPQPALGHQESALGSLRRAEAAMNDALQQALQQQLQMMAQMLLPRPSVDPRDEMRLRLAGLEAIAEQMASGSWRVQLPPRAREEVTQSMQERFPRGYERLLRTYFQNLAQGTGE